ncbi:MAG TPA: AMP-binding protein, partial [Candidatus Lokiarchaeia archaeon]|nr:AMP-binding protein [Candidatus Lokiarchaeia archaeon]
MAFEIKYENLNEVLDSSLREFPNKIFVKYEDNVLTYEEFHEQVLRLANVFLSIGVKKGDYIGIQLANSIEFCVSIYACYRIGAVATPIISLWQAREVAEVVEKAKIDTFVIKGSITAVVNKVAKMESVHNIILVGDEEYDYPNIKGKFWDLIAAAAPDDPGIEVKRADLASCHFTAGTTGQSKGVLHDHLAYLYTGLVHLDTYSITHDDYSNLVLPMYH